MNTQQYHPAFGRHRQCQRNGNHRLAFGGLIILIGLIVLGRKLGLWILPFHMGPVILLAIGLYSGVKNNFRNFGSWVLILLGIMLMIPRFMIAGVMTTHLVGPLLLIVLGLWIIFKPKRRWMQGPQSSVATIDDDTLDVNVSFGERTSIVTSKSFKGGTISNTFGETRINLMQADSLETMILDVRVSFGSLEIVLPSHWDVEFDVSNNFASIEDKRHLRIIDASDKRILRITGSCSFASIAVKSL